MSPLANPLRHLRPLPQGGAPIHRQLLVVVLALLMVLAAVALLTGIWGRSATHLTGFKGVHNYWYSLSLRRMGEPVLRAGDAGRSYRFLWLRTFHHPVAVRIEGVAGQHRLIAVELDGAGGYGMGQVRRRKAVELSPAQFAQFEQQLTARDFWALPATDAARGNDGAGWVIEAATDRYHAVDRWSPTSGPVRDIGLQMLALSGWSFDDDEVY